MSRPNLTSSGVRLDRERSDVLAEGEYLRPLRDHLIVRPLEWKPSTIIEVAGTTHRPLRGVVVSAGPGCYPWKYSKDRRRKWESLQFRPMQCRVGDTVELGGLEIGGYMFPQILIDSVVHVICREEDVTGIADAETESADVPRETTEAA